MHHVQRKTDTGTFVVNLNNSNDNDNNHHSLWNACNNCNNLSCLFNKIDCVIQRYFYIVCWKK